jgi:glycine cleavage system H protein
LNGDYKEVTYDKFTFKVDQSCLYHPNETWAREEYGLIMVGVTDFLQINSGDVAFLEAPEVGAELVQGGEAGIIETIKSTVTLISPVSGMVEEVNTSLGDEPELINNDAYGAGWIMKIKPANWAAEKDNLLSPDAYFPIMEEKVKKTLDSQK